MKPPRTLQENLDALGRAQWLQLIVTIGFGLFGAVMLFLIWAPRQ